MDLEKLFLTRQSTREFCEKPVTDEEIERICKLAVLAPSAVNAQPYKIFGINGQKAKEFTCNIQIDGANKWANTVTAYVVIEQCKPYKVERGTRVISNEPFIANDVGILTAYIALAAEYTGVQSCIVGLRDEKGIAKFLNRPEDTRFPLVIALGHKVDGYPLREKQRQDFESVYKLIK